MPEVRNILIRRRGNPESVSKSEYDFPNNTLRSWYSLLKHIGIENFCWHDLRHCCASYLRQDGKSLCIIGSHLGHKDAASKVRISLCAFLVVVQIQFVPTERNCFNQFSGQIIINSDDYCSVLSN